MLAVEEWFAGEKETSLASTTISPSRRRGLSPSRSGSPSTWRGRSTSRRSESGSPSTRRERSTSRGARRCRRSPSSRRRRGSSSRDSQRREESTSKGTRRHRTSTSRSVSTSRQAKRPRRVYTTSESSASLILLPASPQLSPRQSPLPQTPVTPTAPLPAPPSESVLRTPTRSVRRSGHSSRRSSSSRHRHESQRSQHSHHRRSSSSTQDYSPTLSDSPSPRVSPIDDVNTFQEVLVRGATKLNIPLAVPAPSTSVIFETLHHRTSSRPLLPLVPGLLEPAMDIFLAPAATKSAPSRLIKKYRPPEQDPLFLRSDPVPDSVVIVAAKKLHSTSPSSSSPPDKESRKIDAAARKVCSTAAVMMKAASATALLGRYDRALWDSLMQFAEHLPKDKREDFLEVVGEGAMVSNQIISAAADSSVLSAHNYAHGIALRRHAWLRLTSLKPEAQQRIQNLPFSGSTLFGSHADDEMARMKAELDTLKAVGMERPKEQRKVFRPYQRRLFTHRYQSPHWMSSRPQQQQQQQHQRGFSTQRRSTRGRSTPQTQATRQAPTSKP
ncbi:hypothetical protein NDU88_002593 [Pleurodeles waltl]|uniref:Lamina-associated polypeptide 2 alpha C-terminal domain-containing protein n=1 Tax=Pleurodeles waltl TaxID=8319 RepID=A0AAV7NHK3_PLEWA|nr:hypothetical protein NDU88_002593 [Pleurodeles waltl]